MVPPETKQTCTNDLRATLGAPQSAPKRPWVSCRVAHTRARHGNSPKEYLERPPGEDEPTKMWPIMTKPTVTLTKERSLPGNGVSGGSGRRPSYKKDTNS